jgi:hypothetical protein
MRTSSPGLANAAPTLSVAGFAFHDNEFADELLRCEFLSVMLDSTDEEIHGCPGHELVVGVDRRQRRHKIRRFFNIVESDHSHVRGNSHSPVGETSERPDADGIGNAENAIEFDAAVDERTRSIGASRHREHVNANYQARVKRDPSVAERLEVTLKTQAGHVNLVTVSTIEHRNPSGSVGDQVSHRRARTLDIGHRDVIDGPFENPLAQNYNGVVDFQEFRIGWPQAHGAQDESVVEAISGEGKGGELVGPGPASLLDDDSQVVSRGGRNDFGAELAVVWAVDFGYGQPDRPCASDTQVACRDVHSVIEGGDGLQHFLASCGPHMWMLVDHMGHRHRRNPGRASDVLYRYQFLSKRVGSERSLP